jgi:hypothetical protein
MKKTLTSIALAAAFALSNTSYAQFTDLLSFGTGGAYGALGDGSVGTQTADGVNYSAAIALSDGFFQANALSPTLDWSSYSNFFLKVQLTNNPNLPFTLSFNSDEAGANKLSSTSNNAGSVVDGGFTYIPLTKTGNPTLTGIEYVNFNWDNNSSGAVGITISAVSVPEPSTYALMALGGLVLFFIGRRRKAQV